MHNTDNGTGEYSVVLCCVLHNPSFIVPTSFHRFIMAQRSGTNGTGTN